MMLSASECANFIDSLQRGLRALRLNRHFPPWRDISAHLGGVGVLPPGEDLRLDEDSGWPHPEEWLRVRVDQRLAPQLLARLQPLVDARDPDSVAKADYFTAMLAAAPIGEGRVSVGLIEQSSATSRFEIVVDRLELGRPVFVRWTLRLAEAGAERLAAGAIESHASEHFTRRLQRLASQDAVSAMLLLRAEPGLEVEEIVRGEIGPLQPHPDGVRLSAVLSRAAPNLARTSVDDTLTTQMTIPNEDAGFGLSHHRKWAAPKASLSLFKHALRESGSRNIVYSY
ncbi:MAG: hypothetical protein ACI8S6_001587 [Myxococcota bacterium]|jgi:hypothetical protein